MLWELWEDFIGISVKKKMKNRGKNLTSAINLSLGEFDDLEKYFSKLEKLVLFPTESQVLKDYLIQGIGPLFEELGYNLEILENPINGCGPVLLATRDEGAALTVLGYGHGDVILGQEGLWEKGRNPWKLEIDGKRVYGRGTADNKGQHLTHLTALKSVLKVRGSLGFNHRFVIEMGEENGSKGFRQLVQEKKEKFSADVFFASDGPRSEINKPNITLGNRGVLNFDLLCSLRKGGHHSGNWGGLLANPAIILANAISTIVDRNGRILVDGISIKKIPKTIKVALQNISRDGGKYAPEIDPEWGPKNRSIIEKVTASNSFEVLAILSGNPESPVNSVPPEARAACQLRFVVGTNLNEIIPILRSHLDLHGFNNITIEEPASSNRISFEASRTSPDNPFAEWMQSVISKACNSPCSVLPNSAGSNMTEVVQYDLKIPIVWLPLSYTGCSQHAPNEHILIPLHREGLAIVTEVYWKLGDETEGFKPNITKPKITT
jgi:acetylornithine deacetylase/succinyl-diaminopimelate desuccinylase-like protein